MGSRIHADSSLTTRHLTVYDLVILAPAFLLLGNWAADQNICRAAQAVPALLYLSYPLFSLGPIARVTHLQLSVVALAALFWITATTVSASLIRSPDATLNTP
jgi:hypothetical protein